MTSPRLSIKAWDATAACSLACLAALLAATGAQGTSTSATAIASRMVLSRREIGHGFRVHQEAFTSTQLARQGTWTLAQLKAWGYEGGFERVFDRNLHTVNGEQIASNAGVYRTASGATQSLIANGNACTIGPWKILHTPKHLGNQAVFCTQTATEDGYRGRLYFLVWRVGRFKGSISLSGVVNHVTAAKAIDLARRQAVKT